LAIHELDENLIDIASNLAFSEKITFYDAVYVALAKKLQGTFITADEELLRQLGEETKKDAMLLIDYG
jgi:predicted nucleic acid-binding protein